MVQGQVFLKGGLALFLLYLIFSRFINFTFRNYPLQNSKLSKNEPENIP